MRQKLKRLFQLIAITLAIGLVIFQLNGTTFAAGIDYDALSAQTGGRFSPAGLEKFAQQLRDDYVPVMLGNITTKFESLSKPTIPNLKIGLNLIHRPDKKRFGWRYHFQWSPLYTRNQPWSPQEHSARRSNYRRRVLFLHYPRIYACCNV